MFYLELPIAWGIANLPMLGWLALAAAPLLIHLWSRRKHARMDWAAMEFLLAAVKRRTQRIRLEQWLLLAVRTLVIVLIVLAAAEPFQDRAGSAWIGGGQTHRVIVVDGSYSMGFKPGDRSRFEQARLSARQIVETSPQGDAFSLILMASPPRAVIATPALASAEVLQEIDNLQSAATALDLPATVEMVQQQIARAQRELPRLDRHEVCFLTDLGRVGWVAELSTAAMAEFRRKSVDLSEKALVMIVDLGQPNAENLAVVDLQPTEPYATPAEEAGFTATLRNFGKQPRNRQNVEFYVDGRRTGKTWVDVPAGGQTHFRFGHRFDAPGDHGVEVRAEGDLLPLDNRRYLALTVKPSLRVLCVDGRPSGEPFRGAADYLAAALAPRGPQGGVQVEVAPETALMERDLARYDAVFLCGVSQCTSSEARALAAYLHSGGSLVLFLGEGVEADRYNRELGGGEGKQRILPGRLEQVVSEPQYGLDAKGFRHPIVRAFRGRGEASLVTMPVLKHFRVALPKDSRARVVLALANGDPLLIEEAIGRGRVMLMTTSADVSWTPMPLWPGYPPLVQEMLAFCAATQQRHRNVLVGEPLVGSVAASGEQPTSLQLPDGRSRTLSADRADDGSLEEFGDAPQSGIYTVRLGSQGKEAMLFAANLDTRESDLTQISLGELRDEVWPGVAFEHVPPSQEHGMQTAGAPVTRASRFAVELLLLTSLLLLAETILAWRFGYHRS